MPEEEVKNYDADNVGVGKPKLEGSVYRAPLGTTFPKNATDPLGAEFVSMGYSSDDGLVNSSNRESESLKAWGGQTVYTSQTSVEDTYKVTLIETLKSDVLKAVYGDDSVEGDLEQGIKVAVGMEEPDAAVWVFDMYINQCLKRVILPNAKVTELGDITYKDDELVGFEITISALPYSDPETKKSTTHYEYIIKDDESESESESESQ